MKITVCLLFALVFAVHAGAQATPASPKQAAAAEATPQVRSKRAALTYNPPKNVAVGTRIDGDAGTRSGNVRLPSLYVLAPNHTALTTREQPSLFWFQSDPASTRFELSLIEPKKPKPLLKVRTEKSERAGIHRVALARHGIKLDSGVTYKWTVAFVPDPDNRSQDVIASGTIRRIDPSAKLSAELSAAGSENQAAIYASHGIWYDAFEALSDQINAAPGDRALHQKRASLLAQVGLSAAAAAERR